MKVQSSFKPQKIKSKYFLLFLFFILIIFLSFSIFKKEIFGVSINILDLKEKISITFQDKNKLVNQNKELLSRLSEVENNKKILDFYEIENKRLKKELNYRSIYDEKRLVFNIINNHNKLTKNSLLIFDSNGSVEKDSLVFSKYNLLIGKVTYRIGDNVNIELYSESGKKNIFYISLGGKNILKVEAEGVGGGILKVIAPRGIDFNGSEKVYLVHPNNSMYLVAYKIGEEFEVQDENTILYFKLLVNPFLLNKIEVLNVKYEKK